MAGESNSSTARIAVRVACASVGLACLLRMLLRSFRLFHISSYSHEANLMVHAFFMAALLVSLCALITLRDKVDTLLMDSRAFLVFGPISCTAMYWLADVLVGPAFETATLPGIVIVFAYALALALCVCSWGCVLFKLDLLHAIVSLAIVPPILSFLLLATSLFHIKPPVLTGVMAIVMVPCCYFAFNDVSRPRPQGSWEGLKALPTPALVVLLCGIYACAIAAGVLSLDDLERSSVSELVGTFAISLTVGASLALGVVTKSSGQGRRFEAIIQVVCTLLVIGVLFVAIGFTLLGSNSRLPTSLISVARQFCIIGCLVLLTEAMQKRALSPTLVFSLFCIAGIVIPQIIRGPVTPAVNSAANDILLENQEIAMLVISGVLIFVTFILLVPIKGRDDEPDAAVEARERTMQDAYDTIASGYGLTSREREVMQLIAEGNSMRKVGELLFISLGTVQSHSKKIYKKLDIHSRQELLDLIERHSS